MTQTETNLLTMRAAILRHDLLAHPFYRAWSAGTLPLPALGTYAREYGAFIELLDRGWNELEEPEGAAAERQHVALWGDFAAALDTSVASEPTVDEVKALVAEAERAFASAPEAIGALYAFELQQPGTARSKLAGLVEHYSSVSPLARPYFEAHANETCETTLLEAKLAALGDADQARAVAACERMAEALWDALGGIHSGAC